MIEYKNLPEQKNLGQQMIKKEKAIFAILLICTFCLLFSKSVNAEDAEVLPKGVFTTSIKNMFYFPSDERFNPDGDAEDIAVDYNTTLNGEVFGSLSFLEGLFGMAPGSANIGDSDVSFELDFNILELFLAYGITDKLAIGIKIPYWWVENKVHAEVDPTNASLVKNPFLGLPPGEDPFLGAPLVPIELVPTPFRQKLNTSDIQNLLGAGLDVNGNGSIDIKGFGYDEVKKWSGDGFSDIEAGFKYQYLKTENWQLAFTGAVRFPTGKEDDPDNLQDYALGQGAYALLFKLHNDYKGIKNLLLDATFSYDLYLPDKAVMRVPDDVDLPITINKEEVDRNLGDIFELELMGQYNIARGLYATAYYIYGYRWEHSIDGDLGYAYESLEQESGYTSHIYKIGLMYSTVPLYLDKEFPVPLKVSLLYRDRFKGTDNIMKSQYLSLSLQVYF